ncbi:TPA: ABC transporter ATP-binding protein [Enterobacter hormaechei subsp. steigerwaltii]|nr:ABC transporter ATP-binding protein [Enterobacter hormaechei subsp. steigerwaltii]
MQCPLINIENLSVFAANKILVEPISLQVFSGKPVTILGETGAGKSLIAQVIMGCLPAGLSYSGKIEIAGKSTSAQQRQALWGQTLAMLPQEPWSALSPAMKSQFQIQEVFTKVLSWKSDKSEHRTNEILDRLGIQQARDKIPTQLSGGMAQRVAFAAATAAGAELVLADEPTKGLDAIHKNSVVSMLQLQTQNGGLLTITHDIDVAEKIGGEVLVLREGKLVEQADCEQLFTHPQHTFTKKLIAASPKNWPQQPKQNKWQGQPLVQLKNITKQRQGKILFENLNLDIYPGQILGISGESGCGKSSLGDVILGLLSPDAGKVAWNKNIVAKVAPVHLKQKLYQDPVASFAASTSLKQLCDDLTKRHQLDQDKFMALINQLGLNQSMLERNAEGISGGELQRLALARVLMLKPELIIADEPTSRLDLITARQITELLVHFAKSQNCALVLISHDLEQLDKVCDSHLVLSAG